MDKMDDYMAVHTSDEDDGDTDDSYDGPYITTQRADGSLVQTRPPGYSHQKKDKNQLSSSFAKEVSKKGSTVSENDSPIIIMIKLNIYFNVFILPKPHY